MRSYKKISISIATIVFLSLGMINIFFSPDDNKILIRDVVISNKNNLSFVSFNQEIILDYLIREAIDKGIPLVFKLTLRVVEKDDIWPTKIIKREVRYYQIEYKALRKIYKVEDVNGKHFEYKNMDEAIQKILKVDDLEFMIYNPSSQSVIDSRMLYQLWLNVSLERKKLPKPIQVNYFDRTWHMKSEKSIHNLGELN
tara:strand:- start:3286 stop:3879 length:594 start_codon:yes stop_codon:yes gene_type:complete